MATTATRPVLRGVTPFFIVGQLRGTIDFYVQRLRFFVDVILPKEETPYFSTVRRDDACLMFKETMANVLLQPNHTRHGWARWDAYVFVPDPDALYEEYKATGVTFHRPLEDTDDGLRAFEVVENNGYVLCFGRVK